MKDNSQVRSQGTYTGYEKLLSFFQEQRKATPRGVSLKLQKQRNSTLLLLQFKFPDTGKRSTKGCNVTFTYEGIVKATEKAHKVSEALSRFEKASEFWEWYDKAILEKNELENDYQTYRDIFQKIENDYWNNRNQNTKRERSKDIKNDVDTFKDYYQRVFNKFSNWDKNPSWEEIKAVLFSWKQGTKSFRNAYFALKKICSMSHNSDTLLEKMDDIEHEQTEFHERQSISISQFLTWHDTTKEAMECTKHSIHKQAKKSWLWVSAMCVLYGLRPSEIAAARNLTTPVTIDGYTFKSIDDPTNKDLLLVLGDKTYFGTTIKTGERICMPMVKNEQLLKRLNIREPSLPKTKAKDVRAFSRPFRQRLVNWNCPVTQPYALRHLGNQLGEMYGVPQEIRSRSLGHSVAVNDRVYKKRSNVRTTVDILTGHSKQPLSLNMAKQALENNGFDLEQPEIKAMLSIIYQLDN